MTTGSETTDVPEVLHLQTPEVVIGSKRRLDALTLDIPRARLVTVMGPGGAGKSTFVRALANELGTDAPVLRIEDEVVPSDAVLFIRQRPDELCAPVKRACAARLPDRSTLDQAAQRAAIRARCEALGATDLIEHLNDDIISLSPLLRRLALLVAASLAEPQVLLIDELDAELTSDDKAAIWRSMHAAAGRHVLIVVSHHRANVRSFSDHVVMLAGGGLVASLPTDAFFAEDADVMVRHFVTRGGCPLPSSDHDDDAVAPGYRRAKQCDDPIYALRHWLTPIDGAPSAHRGPTSFGWLVPGRLAAAPRPGINISIDDDLAALRRVGVTHILTLTETALDADAVARSGLHALHLPIPDRFPPTPEQAEKACIWMATRLAHGGCVVVHCHAGIGRTGTILALLLVSLGMPGLAAVREVRRLTPRMIQTDAQYEFVLASASAWADQPPLFPNDATQASPTDNEVSPCRSTPL